MHMVWNAFKLPLLARNTSIHIKNLEIISSSLLSPSVPYQQGTLLPMSNISSWSLNLSTCPCPHCQRGGFYSNLSEKSLAGGHWSYKELEIWKHLCPLLPESGSEGYSLCGACGYAKHLHCILLHFIIEFGSFPMASIQLCFNLPSLLADSC